MTEGNVAGPSSVWSYVPAKIKTGPFQSDYPKLCWSYCLNVTSFMTKHVATDFFTEFHAS